MEFWSNTFTGCGGWREEKSWLELLLWVMAVMLIPVHFVDSPHVDFRYTRESASPFYLKFYKSLSIVSQTCYGSWIGGFQLRSLFGKQVLDSCFLVERSIVSAALRALGTRTKIYVSMLVLETANVVRVYSCLTHRILKCPWPLAICIKLQKRRTFKKVSGVTRVLLDTW